MITINQEDYQIALKLIESEIDFKFNEIDDIENYFFAGQALSTAILYVKGIIPFFYVNDIDLFAFSKKESLKKKRSYGFDRRNFYLDTRIEEINSRKTEEKEALKKQIYNDMINEHDESVLINKNEDYYYSKSLRDAVNLIVKINNIDDYSISQGSHELRTEYLKEIIQGCISDYVESKVTNFKTLSDIKFYNDGNYLKIISSDVVDIFNFITYYTYLREGQNVNYFEFLESFDINMVQVGYDFKNKKGYCTSNFLKFLNTRNIEVTNLKSPYQTAIRLFKKYDEFVGSNIHCNIDLNSQIIAQVMAFENKEYFEKITKYSSEETNNIFGHRYIDKANKLNFRDYFLVSPINKKETLFKLDTKTIEPIEFIDNRSHYNSLKLKNKYTGNVPNYKNYPKLLKNILPELAFNDFYLKEKTKKSFMQGTKLESKKVDIKVVSKTRKDNEIKLMIQNKLPIYKDTHNLDKLVDLIRTKLYSHYHFVTLNISYLRRSFYINSYQQIIEFFKYISSFKDDSIIGYMEDYKNLKPIYNSAYFATKPDEVIQTLKENVKNAYSDLLKKQKKEYSLLDDFISAKFGKYTFTYLNSPYKLKMEGKEMRHCIGGYTRKLENKEMIAFSLKNKSDKSERATFHFIKHGFSDKFTLSQYVSFENKKEFLKKEMYYSTILLINYINNLENIDISIDKKDAINYMRIDKEEYDEFVESLVESVN